MLKSKISKKQLEKEVFLLEHGFYDSDYRAYLMKYNIVPYNHQFFVEGRMVWFKRKLNISRDLK